ncbi:oligopeptide:H+ symporter [Francisellaceae bacterium]|nr:oligopeptide:H+ symporter [Francisellaceae bacterium]
MSANFFQHPKPFYTIFMLEIWERFGYASLVGLLAVYLTKSFGLKSSDSFVLYGSFAALVYAFIVVGGFIGDKILGAKRTIVLGLLTLLLGYIFLALNNLDLVYYAMALICVGTGLFKSNPSSLLSKCYPPDDDGLMHNAFTLFYMAINIGSIVGLLLIPSLAHSYGYSTAFGTSAIAIVLALAVFVGFGFTMKQIGSEADKKPLNYGYLLGTIIVVIALVFCVEELLVYLFLSKAIVVLTFLICLIIFIYLTIKSKSENYAGRMSLALVMMFEAIVYKIAYMQMQTSINFYTINNASHSLFGIELVPESFQALNPFWVVFLSPILAYYYTKSDGTKFSLSVYNKFSVGMVSIGLAFICLFISKYTADSQGIVSGYWLLLSYGLQSLGELLICAIGIAMVTQLVPSQLSGFAVGMWWVFLAFGSLLGGFIASLTSPKGIETTDKMVLLVNYTNVFFWIGLCILAFSVFMFCLAPIKARLLAH